MSEIDDSLNEAEQMKYNLLKLQSIVELYLALYIHIDDENKVDISLIETYVLKIALELQKQHSDFENNVKNLLKKTDSELNSKPVFCLISFFND